MKNIIPYEKDIKFDTKIAEITSISLEHEEQTKNDEIIGNFIVSGDYKVHLVSVNKTDFNYNIPFNIELTDNIDKDSIIININDFTYDIKDSNTLTVKIELLLSYDEIKLNDEKEEVKDIEPIVEEEVVEEKEQEVEEEREQEQKQDVINETIKAEENTYVTYHVYVIDKEDTLESICQKFNVSKETLHLYNSFDELKMGDKLLIPLEDE